MLVLCQAGNVQLLDVVSVEYAVGGSVGIVTLKLYKNDVTPGLDSVESDFDEADFDGYADFDLTWPVGPYINPTGQAEIQAPSNNWTPTGAVTPNTVYGYYLVDSGGDLIGGERFDSPRAMNGILTSLTLLASLVLIPGGISANVQPLDT